MLPPSLRLRVVLEVLALLGMTSRSSPILQHLVLKSLAQLGTSFCLIVDHCPGNAGQPLQLGAMDEFLPFPFHCAASLHFHLEQ